GITCESFLPPGTELPKHFNLATALTIGEGSAVFASLLAAVGQYGVYRQNQRLQAHETNLELYHNFGLYTPEPTSYPNTTDEKILHGERFVLYDEQSFKLMQMIADDFAKYALAATAPNFEEYYSQGRMSLKNLIETSTRDFRFLFIGMLFDRIVFAN